MAEKKNGTAAKKNHGAAEAVPPEDEGRTAGQAERETPPDIFLTEITIRHVRHLRDIVIPLSDTERKTLILTGENGSGKSSVLEALELLFRRDIEQSRQTAEAEREAESLQVSARASVPLPELWVRYRDGLFILARFDDERCMAPDPAGDVSRLRLERGVSMDQDPSDKLVQYLTRLKLVQAFAAMDGDKQKARELDAWFDRFQSILRTLYDDPALSLDFDPETLSFTIRTAGRDPFDFSTMASGFSAVCDVIADLILRMEAASPGNYNLPGIVLIDEIEVHLHVGLQKKILPILTELFPRIQFIVTTHSPFVLSSAKDAVVYDLERRSLAAEGLGDLPYAGIVEGFFGAGEMSAELDGKLDRYRALAGKKEWTDADYADAAALELELDRVPDFLAAGWKAEYSRLKLEIAADKGE